MIASACVPGPSATPAPAFVRPKILTGPSGGQATQRAPPFPFAAKEEAGRRAPPAASGAALVVPCPGGASGSEIGSFYRFAVGFAAIAV